jgi:hypothetical protein
MVDYPQLILMPAPADDGAQACKNGVPALAKAKVAKPAKVMPKAMLLGSMAFGVVSLPMPQSDRE